MVVLNVRTLGKDNPFTVRNARSLATLGMKCGEQPHKSARITEAGLEEDL